MHPKARVQTGLIQGPTMYEWLIGTRYLGSNVGHVCALGQARHGIVSLRNTPRYGTIWPAGSRDTWLFQGLYYVLQGLLPSFLFMLSIRQAARFNVAAMVPDCHSACPILDCVQMDGGNNEP